MTVAELRAILQAFKNDDPSTLSSLQYVLAVLLDYTYSLPVGGGITQLTGDVTAGPGAGSQVATVTGLDGNPVSAASPSPGDALVWDGTQWAPAAGGGGGTINGTIAANEIAFGTGVDSIGGSAQLEWNAGTGVLTVSDPAVTPVLTVDTANAIVDLSVDELRLAGNAGAAGEVLTSNGAGVAPTWQAGGGGGGLWSKTGTELSPATAGDTVQIEITAGTAGVTVEDTPASLISEVRPGVLYLTDNLKVAELNTVSASLLLKGDSGEAIPVVPTITAQDFDGSAAPLDLTIGELRVNTAPGAAGEVLTSQGAGNAPSWTAQVVSPRWVVGNTLKGDPSTSFTSAFNYVADAGDGAGIQAAIAAATLAGGGDILVRSGIYTLPSGVSAFQIPTGVTLRGAGWETEIISADDQRAVFMVDEGGTLADLKITMAVPVVGATGDLVVELAGSTTGNATVSNVYVDCSLAGAYTDLNESLIGGIGSLAGAFGSVGARVFDCVVIGSVYSFSDPTFARKFACFSFPDADQAVIRGQGLFGDYLLRLTGSSSRCLIDLQGENYKTAELGGLWHQIRLTSVTQFVTGLGELVPVAVTGTNLQRSKLQLLLSGSDIDVTAQALTLDANCVGNQISLTCDTYGTGATIDGSKNNLSGISVDAGIGSTDTGVVFTAFSSNNVMVGGVLDVATTPYSDLGTGNEIAHIV